MKSNKLLSYAIIFLIIPSLSFSQQSENHLVKLVELNSCGISIFPHIKHNKLEVDLNYGISWHTKDAYEIDNLNKFVELEIEYHIYSINNHEEITNNRYDYVQPIINRRMPYQQYVNKVTHVLPIGDFDVAITIKNILTNDNLSQKSILRYNPNVTNELGLSGILLASEIKAFSPGQDTTFRQAELYVVPYPFSAINKKEQIFCYFEMDNISLNNSFEYKYQVEYELSENKKSFLSIHKENTMISSSYVGVSSSKFNQEYFSVDFSNMKNGKYKLTINVKDLTTKEAKSTDVNIDLIG